MRKFLFIGVGGSGGKTLRFLKDSIEKRLVQAGYHGAFPEAWQFIQLDLPPNDDSPAGGPIPKSLSASYKGLAPTGVTFDNHRTQLGGLGDGAVIDDLATWWPDPLTAPKNVWFGAGQYRAVGRLVVLNRLPQLADAIKTSVTAMETVVANQRLTEACTALGFPISGDLDEPLAIVIGSMAGGTGSGAILDVCDMLRISGRHGKPFLTMPFAVLYTSEIFAGLAKGGAVPGVEPNSLAFMSEMSALQKNKTSVMPPYHASSGQAAELTQRGPALAFLIGRSNGSLTLADDVEVFRSTAQAITAWVVDPTVQKTLQSSPMGNLELLGRTQSYLPMHAHEAADQPVASFGYARFEVGRERFHQYAAERLGRHAIDHLLRVHLHRSADGASGDTALNERATEQRMKQFLRDCGLNERHAADNDIIDAILANAEAHARDLSQSAPTLAQQTTMIGADIAGQILDVPVQKNFNPNAAVGQLRTRVEGQVPLFVSSWDNLLAAGAAQWCEEVQSSVVGVVTTTLAEEGLPVTLRLLELADADLVAAIGELQNEASLCRTSASDSYGLLSVPSVKQKAQSLIKSLKVPFATTASRRLQGEVEASRREHATRAIQSFRTNFLQPLRLSLDSAEQELKDQWATVQEWAAGDSVPNRFKPDPNVVVLTDVENFPAEFNKHLAKTVGGNSGEALDLAVAGVLKSRPGASRLDEGDAGSFIRLRPWSVQNSTKASFDLDCDAASIRQRSRDWLAADPTNGIGLFINESLQERLKSASGAELERFVARFRMALDRSVPLVHLNAQMLNEIHRHAEPQYQSVMSAIPLTANDDDKAFQAVRNLLLEKGIDAAEIPKYFETADDTSASASNIEISTFMRAYHPMVYASLMRPIAVAALEALGMGEKTFWEYRRARPLDEFIPLSSTTVNLIARGWLTALILRQVRFEPKTAFGHPYVSAELRVPGGGKASFTSQFLGRYPADNREVFAAILETYAVAEAYYSTGQPGVLSGYTRLLELGAGAALSGWIITGDADVDGGPSGNDAEERMNLAVEILEAELAFLQSSDKEFEPSPAVWSLPPRSDDVRTILISAVSDLIQAAKASKSASIQPASGGGLYG